MASIDQRDHVAPKLHCPIDRSDERRHAQLPVFFRSFLPNGNGLELWDVPQPSGIGLDLHRWRHLIADACPSRGRPPDTQSTVQPIHESNVDSASATPSPSLGSSSPQQHVVGVPLPGFVVGSDVGRAPLLGLLVGLPFVVATASGSIGLSNGLLSGS